MKGKYGTGSFGKHAKGSSLTARVELLEARKLATATPFTGAYDTDAALDGNGTLHVAWYDAALHDLKYATRTSSGVWSSATVVHGAAQGSGDVGQYVSIALDAQGRPGLAYADSYNADLYYATLANGVWSRTRIDTRNSLYASLAYGTDNVPVVSYYSAVTDDLVVARQISAGVWDRIAVDQTDDVGRSTSIALFPGTTNRFAVAYEKSTGFDFRYIEQTGTTWNAASWGAPQTIDGTTVMGGGHTSLAFGAGNLPAVAYYDADNADTKFASRAGNGTWSSSAVWSEKSQFNTLFYDTPNARFMLIATEYRSDQLVLFTQAGSAWDVSALAAAGGKTAGAGVRADGSFGYAYISRFDPVNALSADVRPIALGTPAKPAAAPLSSSQIRITWQDKATGEAGYAIERSTDAGTTFSEIGVTAANATSYTDTSLTAGTQYWHRVRALTSSSGTRTGYSPYSYVRAATTSPAAGTPVISEDFTSGAGGFAALDGSWAPTSGAYWITSVGAAATTHLNSRSIHSTALTGDLTLDIDASVVATSSPWNDFAVMFDYQDTGNYYFVSFNEGNDGATSGIFRVVNGTSTELADIAGGITADTNYHVRIVRAGNQITAFLNGTQVATASDATFTGGKVGLGTKGDNASYDNLIVTGTAAPVPTTPPTAPSSLTATAGSSTRIDLAWSDNSSTEDGFKIERSANGGSTWTQIGTVGAGVTSYAATGLTASTAYQFRVRSYNVAGNSAYTAAASATTQAAPAVGAKPGASNTGPTNPSALQAVGSLTISTAGTVIENIDVTGVITITANNVTIRNFRINAGGVGYAISIANGVTGTVMEDGEVTNFGEAVCYSFENYTARRLNVHHAGKDGFKAEGNVLIEGCWIHHLGMTADSHADGVQVSTGAHIIVRNNFFDMPFGQSGFNSNSAIIIKADFGAIDDVLFEGNWANGGNFTLYSRAGSSFPAPTNVRFLNNRFGREYQYGIYSIDGSVTISGNVWDDTDQPVNS